MGCKCNLRKKLLKRNISLGDRDIYLDYAATTKPLQEVLYTIDKINRIYWGNPSSQNNRGSYLYSKIEESCRNILNTLNLDDSKIYFDGSASLIANKLTGTPLKCITKITSHLSLTNPNTDRVNVDNNDRTILGELEKKLETDTVFIYSPVNHEIGALDDFVDIYKLCKNKNVPVIIDAVQLITKLPISDWIDYCDGFYFSGHKIHSIPGGACLILKPNCKIALPVTSTIEYSIFDGTFNSQSIAGLLKAFEILLLNINDEVIYLESLTRDGLSILKNIKSEIRIETPENSLPGIINFSIKDIDSIEDLLEHLNKDSIYLSRFSACTGEISNSSEILTYIGREGYSLKNSLRVSFGKDSQRGDFYSLVNSINNFITV